MHYKHRLTILTGTLIILVSVFFPWRTASTMHHKKGSILFYNSEININNFVSIKVMYDKYLAQYDINFQPFDDKAICEKTFQKSNIPIMLIISSRHFSYLNKKTPLHPLLIATRHDKTSFKKILSVKKPLHKIEDLAGKVVASTSSIEDTKNLLLEMFGEDNIDLLSSIRILNVPKDIDALLAVGYNIAHAAVTTQDSLKLIEKINPGLKRKLNILLTSNEIFMPVAAIKKSFLNEETLKKTTLLLKNMNTSENGRENLSALSIDGWIDISPKIIARLTK